MARPGAPAPAAPTAPVAAPPRPTPPAVDPRLRFFAITTAIFFVTTVLFALMAFAPRAAPIKTTTVRQAAKASVEDEVSAVASRFTQNLITYNYKTITADLNRLQRDVTDAFPKQYHSAMRGDIKAFRKRIIDERASSTGDVKGATLLSADKGTATLLVFSSQTVRSRRIDGESSRYVIIELTMLDTANGWKVDSARVPSAVAQNVRK
jgi:hypothetical protein